MSHGTLIIWCTEYKFESEQPSFWSEMANHLKMVRKEKQVLTYGAVGSRPVGLADAGSWLRVEGAVTGALLRTSALQDLAADAAPAWVTVALTVMTGSVAWARRVHAVHWGRTVRVTLMSVYHFKTGYQTYLFTPGTLAQLTAKNHFYTQVFQCQMMAGEPQLKLLQCLVVAGSNFPPYVQLAPPQYIIGCFQYTDSIIMLHYRQ